MEEKCVDEFQSITANLNKPTSIPTSILTIPNKTSEYSNSKRKENNIHLFNLRRRQFIIQTEEGIDNIHKPSTSRNSMSSLLQEEFSTNSPHNFAEVLDDDTTTSGVLEAFEISSSNSLPTCTTTNASADSVAVHDDSSSTDTTIHMMKVTSDGSTSNAAQCIKGFFNSTKVYVINDDDDDDDDDDDEDDDDDDDDDGNGDEDDDIVSSHGDALQKDDQDVDEHALGNSGSHSNDNNNNNNELSLRDTQENSESMNGVIVSPNGGVIYLETPVVEEQHHLQIAITNSAASNDFSDQSVKPKRLSDEFSKTGDSEEGPSSSGLATANILFCTNGKNIESNETVFNFTESQTCSVSQAHERLKNMNLNNCVTSQELPSSSSKILSMSSILDIKSMDLIERRDFESEQRLTGGVILKSSSLINNDMLNLGFVKSCLDQQNKYLATEAEEWPSSSNNSNVRPYSSDSKITNELIVVRFSPQCTYKDLSATPTSSRKCNSRLTKSTAKINLSTTLSHNNVQQQQPQQQQQQQQKQKQSQQQRSNVLITKASTLNTIGSIAAADPSSSNLSSNPTSVIVEAPVSTAPTMAADMYSNSNSNDSFLGSSSTASSTASTSSVVVASSTKQQQSTCHQEIPQEQQTASSSSTVVVRVLESGCSRTSAIQPIIAANASTHGKMDVSSIEIQDDDVQPSTSSARCQYAPPPKTQRQVHASAQTNERYLSRVGAIGSSTASVGVSTTPIGVNLTMTARNRNRRLDIFGNQQQPHQRNSSQDVLEGFRVVSDHSQLEHHLDFSEEPPWVDCEENSDVEEICTCQQSSSGSSHGGSLSSLNDMDETDSPNICGKDGGDLSNYIMHNLSISEESTVSSEYLGARKRKYNDSRLMDHDYNSSAALGGNSNGGVDSNSRKRVAYDFTATPRSSQSSSSSILIQVQSTPQLHFSNATIGSPLGRRTPRSLIPSRDNPQPELQQWIAQFKSWSHAERLIAVDRLIEHCEPTQVRHMMKVIEPQFQRDFISLLPRELALQVLSYLDPKDLLKAAQTCRSWRFLCDDNLLWKEKCRQVQILTEPRTDRPKRGRAGNMPPIASPWKAAYMRQHIIEMNWRSRPIREPKILKGHDEHVITCLQFSGNRIVSGSDDNTLKVWSAVTGRCLRTLVGHTGGVWSSQMSGNIIISGSTDRTLKVWDMETGQCVHTLLGHTSTVRCMHLHGNKVVSGSRDATLRVWDIEQGSCLRVLVGHLAAVRCVQYDGKLIVSGAYDYMVKIWHPDKPECLHTLQGHTNRVYSLQFDGTHVVSGSLDTSIRVWDVETGNCKHTLMGHQSLTSGMELRENILVSGNADSTVKVWDITTGQCLQTLSGPNKHQSAVTCLQFNSRFVVTSSDDGTVKLWDVKTGEFIRNLVSLESGGSGGVVWRIRANDTKLICAVGSRNGTEETKLMVLDFDVEGACVKCS
uniref:F-box domain-containing protein n=1 Tax=Glossina pallidipes TaxID=7398 RepID=A0A1A9ZS35_GLOPL